MSSPPRTKSAKAIRKAARKGDVVSTAWIDKHRPISRGQCFDEPRPCPWVLCRHHLYLDVGATGSIKLNFPDLEPGEIPITCSLDIADQGGATLDEIGNAMNLSRERIRQLETKIIEKLKDRVQELVEG